MALKRLSKLSYGTLSSLAPALAALAGLVLLHEQISLIQWVALACIMVVQLVSLYVEKRHKIFHPILPK